MLISIYASMPHYFDHLLPVWDALAPERRGSFFVAPRIASYAASKSSATFVPLDGARPSEAVLVSSSGDLISVAQRGHANAAIMEHGAGQTYRGDNNTAASSPSYAGSPGRGAASLFLHPGPRPAALDRAAYPDARVEVVGCPKLDSLPAREPGPPTVAVSFHFDTTIAPETRSTWLYYREHLAQFAAETRGLKVIGHAHPRIIDRLGPWYEKQGIEVVRDFEDVCRRADAYAIDNSSTLFEFASTGRPVVVLNAPYYRRDVDHGLRFWEAASVGENVLEPYDMQFALRRAVESPQAGARAREAALDLVYEYRSGAAERAARVLEDWAS